jgi:hypothetical protein
MKGFLAAVVILGFIAPAYALEPMADDSMSEAVGQSGLTISLSALQVEVDHLRYSSTTGTSGGSGAFNNQGTLDFTNVQLAVPGGLSFAFDVGSTGHTATDNSSAILGISDIVGASFTTGAISSDSGTELTTAGTVTPIGDFQLTNINMSGLKFLITAGGRTQASGLTIYPLMPMNLGFDYNIDDYSNGGVFNGTVTATGVYPSYISLEVGNVGTGLVLSYGNTTIDSISLTNLHIGTNLASIELGGLYLSNIVMPASSITIVGH